MPTETQSPGRRQPIVGGRCRIDLILSAVAVHWPVQVQPYVNAMLKTEVPAEIQCYNAMAAAGSLQGAAAAFGGDSFCRDSTATADKIRSILHLPPTIG